MIKIGIDAMGGDNAPEITVVGSMLAIKQFSDIEIILYGDENKIKKYLTDSTRISIVHTDKMIDMGEKEPLTAIRTNKDSSMLLAFTAAKNKEVDGVVSAGPTQAIVLASHVIIKRIPNMQRVALGPIVQSIDGRGKLVLDVGANVELKPEHLLELAKYGKIITETVLNIENPKVGLLNIGTEPGKGRQFEKECYELLSNDKSINFFGNVESKELMSTECDYILCDGFVGNIAIKSFEGAFKTFGVILKDEIRKSFKGKIGYLFMRKTLKKVIKRIDASEVGGAMVCGINIPLVKAHGSSDAYSFMNAIRQVRQMVNGDVINKITKVLENE